MGTQTAEASMHEALLQSYFAAGTCASGSHDLSSLQLLHLLRCSLILSDPSHFVCENEGEDRERDWERSAHSCHQLRKHVDALRLNCMRCFFFACSCTSLPCLHCSPELKPAKDFKVASMTHYIPLLSDSSRVPLVLCQLRMLLNQDGD